VKHTLVALVLDRPAVLYRTIGLFRRRGFQIDSLAVGASETPGISRITMVVDADNVEQPIKQLDRLIEVLSVNDLTGASTVEREIALVKIRVLPSRRAEMIALAGVYGAKVVDVDVQSMVLELAAYPAKVTNFITIAQQFGIMEMMRSGRIAMLRGGEVSPAAMQEIPALDGAQVGAAIQ
jgi:acetolactate synthase-1/3 small subunit